MQVRLTRKKVIVGVVLTLALLIGGGYFSNLLTIIACEAEVQAFSKEQWKANGCGPNGYIGESKLYCRISWTLNSDCPKEWLCDAICVCSASRS